MYKTNLLILCIILINYVYCKNRLTFKEKEDGTSIFKIVQLTDLHYGEGENTGWGPMQDVNSTRVMITILELEKPDLVLFSGDLITGNNINDNATAYWEETLTIVKELNIPWAVTFGNHDDLSSGPNETRVNLLQFDIAMGSLSQFGPPNIPGVTNYYLPIYSSNEETMSALLWILDSGDGSCNQKQNEQQQQQQQWPCNTYITEDQVEWYASTAKNLYNNGQPLWAAAYFHIPLQEQQTLWDNYICYGWNNDSVAYQPVNGGILDAFQTIGDVKFVSVGHNHGNDFCGVLDGIELCFGRHSGYGGYGTWERGARILEITMNNTNTNTNNITYKTWITFETGERLYNQPIHNPN